MIVTAQLDRPVENEAHHKSVLDAAWERLELITALYFDESFVEFEKNPFNLDKTTLRADVPDVDNFGAFEGRFAKELHVALMIKDGALPLLVSCTVTASPSRSSVQVPVSANRNVTAANNL